MKTKLSLLILIVITTFYSNSFGQDHSIYVGQSLTTGYGMGVDDSGQLRNWTSGKEGYKKMAYPPNLDWGAVFITVGSPTDPPRTSRNFNAYTKLSVEMRGENGGEHVEIGIKDNTDPDNGQETKIPVNNIRPLTNDWQVYEFPLTSFITADVSRLYVVIEFVFEGPVKRTVYFRNVKYMR